MHYTCPSASLRGEKGESVCEHVYVPLCDGGLLAEGVEEPEPAVHGRADVKGAD